MIIGAIFGFGFVVVFIVLLCSPIRINGSADINLHTQTIEIAIYFYHIRVFKRSVDLMEAAQNEEDKLQFIRQSGRDLPQKLNEFSELVTLILSRLHFKKLVWRTDIGTGAADITGMASGGIWGIKSTIVGILTSKSHFQSRPSLTVTPFFNQLLIHSVVDCMISIRLGQAIYALLKIIRKLPMRQQALS